MKEKVFAWIDKSDSPNHKGVYLTVENSKGETIAKVYSHKGRYRWEILARTETYNGYYEPFSSFGRGSKIGLANSPEDGKTYIERELKRRFQVFSMKVLVMK